MIENKLVEQKVKNNLSEAIKIAIGNRTLEDYAKSSRLDIDFIEDILYQNIIELPDKNILRSIVRASQNRITYNYLCYICGYKINDINEDKFWMFFYPERGDIYYVDLGCNMDSEQNGIRPCVIIQNNKGNKNAPIVQDFEQLQKEWSDFCAGLTLRTLR